MQLSKIAAAVISAAAVFSSGANAAGFPDFSVNAQAYIAPVLITGIPMVLPANPGLGIFTADKITGNYEEVVTFNGAGGFDISLKWNAGQFVGNNGATPVANTGLNLGLGSGYGVYALLQGSGSAVTNISTGVTTFTLLSGTVNMYVDDGENTVLVTPGSGGAGYSRQAGTFGDDALLATGTVVSGSGALDPSLSTCGGSGGGINCGSFGQETTFALQAPAGPLFFTAPVPFYNLSFQSGQLNNFTPTGTVVVNGSLDVIFKGQVPEPGSLALAGLALVGLGVSRIRRKA